MAPVGIPSNRPMGSYLCEEQRPGILVCPAASSLF